MKRKIIIAVWLLLIVLVLVVMVCAVVLSDEPDWRLFTKGIVTLVVLCSAAFTKRRRPADYFRILQAYRQEHSEFIRKDCPRNPRYRKMLERAVLELHYDNFAKAIQRLDRLVQQTKQGDDTEALVSALYFRGLCQRASGNYLACAADWEELLRYRANSSAMWNFLAATYFRMDRADDAIRCYDTSLLYDGDAASAYGGLATVYYLKKNDPKKAIEYAEKALQVMPELYGAYSTLALAYRSLGNLEKSAYCRNQYAAHESAEDTAGLDEMLARIPVQITSSN